MGTDYPEHLLARESAPPYGGEGPFALWHFSEDPSLGRFLPHTPARYVVMIVGHPRRYSPHLTHDQAWRPVLAGDLRLAGGNVRLVSGLSQCLARMTHDLSRQEDGGPARAGPGRTRAQFAALSRFATFPGTGAQATHGFGATTVVPVR